MKTLSCSDIGIKNCNFVARSDTDKELIDKMTAHATSAHSDYMEEMGKDEMVSLMKLRIKDET